MATDSDKRNGRRLIKSIWIYLSRNATAAFEVKDEQAFDWYSDGLQCFFQCLNDEPFKITSRVKSLRH